MKKRLSTIILILALLAGLSLLLYPTVSNLWNRRHASRAVAAYAEQVTALDSGAYDEMLTAAHAYNDALADANAGAHLLSDAELAEYDALLNLGGLGVMGYIDIPSIEVELPIYHGTSDSVLQVAVGHLDWTSLPVGGASTHAVLSGHRGLPSAKLFTNLDRLALGDTFLIRVLDETLTYEIDQILIVEPSDTSALAIESGRDLCTLVTCTPYGINSHRLLVRGHRIENTEEAKLVRVVSDAVAVDPVIVAPVVALPLLLTAIILLLTAEPKHQGGKDEDET